MKNYVITLGFASTLALPIAAHAQTVTPPVKKTAVVLLALGMAGHVGAPGRVRFAAGIPKTGDDQRNA